jgi:hypothetical protein
VKLLALLVALAGPAFAATTVTPGSWDLYRGSVLLQSGFASQQACVDRAAALKVTDATTCRVLTKVEVTAAGNCGPQPAPQVRSVACPSGTTGSWVQTNAYTAQRLPRCWAPTTWLPTTAPAGTCVPVPPGAVSFTTHFDLAEFPLNEGGAWGKANNAWLNIRTENGVAHAGGVNEGYDDSYAYLTLPFGPDQTVEAVLEVSTAPFDGTKSHEALLMLRMSDDAANARGYECLFNYAGGVDLVKWTGPLGGYQSLSIVTWWWNVRDLRTGDVIKCSVIGDTISGYINGAKVVEARDSTFTSGQPGIGFFTRPGGDIRHLNFTRVTATSN